MDYPWRYRNRADFSIGTARGRRRRGLPAPGPLGLGPAPLGVPPARTGRSRPSARRSRTGCERTTSPVGTRARAPALPAICWCGPARTDRKLLVSLVTAGGDLPERRGPGRASTRSAPSGGRSGPRGQPGTGRDQLRAPFATLWGRPFLLEKMAGLTLKVSIDAFFQTNTLMADALYGLVAQAVGAGARPATDAGDRASAWPAAPGDLGPLLGRGVHRPVAGPSGQGGAGHRGRARRGRRRPGERPPQPHRQRPLRRRRRGQGAARGGRRRAADCRQGSRRPM